jgi:signal transduction histidine kinase
VLTDRGLGPALESLVLRSPFPVEVDVANERLAPAIEAAAYYVASEALANVAKYAHAESARVRIVGDDDRDEILVEVTDDGVGGADPARGSGLKGLEDRVEALDGSLEIDSPPGGGTRIRARIPLARESASTLSAGPASTSPSRPTRRS